MIFLTLTVVGGALTTSGSLSKEFLTDKEIEKIQEAQGIADRVKIYLEAAALRLKAAQDRLQGLEPKTGDPLELFAPEEMLDGYYRILGSVMLNVDDAFQKPGPNQQKVVAALKSLKKSTEKALGDLEILKKIAEEKRKEELWNLVNKSIDITNAAHEGAEFGLSKESSPPAKK